MNTSRLPEWIRQETRASRGGREVQRLLRGSGVHTVCEEACCPNKGSCFSRGRATFLILGDRCTRACGFCAVERGNPKPVDGEEPRRVALTVEKLALKYVVITSVTRDDLSDGGGIQFSRVIHEIRKRVPECRVEVLVPDFDGRMENLERVLEAGPSVLNHNIETVRRLYPRVRPGADYHRSLELLGFAGTHASNVRTKSGLMVGLGETTGEVLDVFRDLRAVGCEMLTVGQYLRPTAKNLPVCEYVHPDVFQNYRKRAEEMGFVKVESAPLVRSSMNAEEMTHV